ncbi:hypothetical protein [uncultured Psychroserpens sp.]|uniref:hypothetical protein n=1 Tax=uncultured Psychroserpens sp. TaxID=255436 RepID=UPI00262134EC|nr:hypothetical protein [uncultured Psychroserpens sp.]
MKNIVLTLLLFGITCISNSQNITETLQKPSVEKSTFGIQTGYAGLWIYNEFRLLDQIALRIELGLNAYDNDDFYPDAGFLFTTAITLEPRWYYNLDKRLNQSKRIDNNSGNFFALKTTFHSNDLLIKFGDDARIVDNLAIIPTWGMRRNIGQHFNYEAGIGVGYIHYFAKNSGFTKDKDETAINLHLRIGYRF